MKRKVIELEFHVDEAVDAQWLLTHIALAGVDAKVLKPGDVVRSREEGVGFEVKDRGVLKQ